MVQHIAYARGCVTLLDQRALPVEEIYVRVTSPKEMAGAIQTLTVRGAPAIGVAAAYGLCLGADEAMELSADALAQKLQADAALLKASRPTAVNLAYAVDRLLNRLALSDAKTAEAVRDTLVSVADALMAEEEHNCLAIGEHLLPLLTPGMGILTHCNAGALATVRYGTALAPILLGAERGVPFHVYADETRPLLQGARLTAWELQKAGVDVTVICDNMAAEVMREGKIGAVIVGCDRLAANGDAANKIGTYGVAVLAKYHNIPFYVAAPTTTIDLATPTGREIVIEQRDPEEVSCGFSRRTAPEGVKIYNPAFDVTPAELITAIVTERGVLRAPYEKSVAACLS